MNPGSKRMATYAVVALGMIGSIFVVSRARPKTPLEIAMLSRSLVSAKIRAFYDHPDLARLEEVRSAVAEHRKVLNHADLPVDVREAMGRDLIEYVGVAQGIAGKSQALRERAKDM